MVTDNTSANKAAWATLENEFPEKFFYGCVAHALNLLVKDIFYPSKTKANNPSKRTDKVAMYPCGFPFEYMMTFVEKCKNLVKFFKSHHMPKSKLEALQLENNLRFLVLPCITRWGTLFRCIESIYNSLDVLYIIVTERAFSLEARSRKDEQMKDLLDFVTDESTSELCENAWLFWHQSINI